MSKYQISRNAKKTNIKYSLLASCALFILPLFTSSLAFSQNVDDQLASIPANNVAQIAPRPMLSESEKDKLRAAINGNDRIESNRDKFRHPEQTLEFFGIKPDATVVEIWPGQGWYTSILGPYLKSGGGHLIAANFDTSTTNSDLVQKVFGSFKEKFSGQPEIFGDVKVVPFGPRSGAIVADNSADAILTFRNIHNWMAQGWSDKAFDDFYRALKPGGILGIEEHRADDDTPQDPMAADGYVRQDYVISLAKDAGFELVDVSEINANPKDTKDHPFGVWTLPPVLRTAPMGQAADPKFDISRYNAIGESDRMTLLFRKPLKVDKPNTMTAMAGAISIPVFFNDKKPKKDTITAKVDAKANLKKEEAKTTAPIETAKIAEVKPPVTPVAKSPSWDKSATKAEVAKIEVDTLKTTKETVTEAVKPTDEAIKDVKANNAIPELPNNIITSDIKPTEPTAQSDVPPAIETKPEVKVAETPQENLVKPSKVETKTKKADSSKEKPAAKDKEKSITNTSTKTPSKATSKNEPKSTAKAANKGSTKAVTKKDADKKAKTTAKNADKTTTKPAAKNTKTTKTTAKPVAKSSTKSSVKSSAKSSAKEPVKATSKEQAKSNKKPVSKTTAATKPTSKSKNPNVPDWSSPKKKKK